MELDGFDCQLAMSKALVCSVVEIDQRLFENVRKRGGVDGVSMVVRGYDDRSVLQIFYRLIAAAMSVRQFKRFRTASQRQELVPQADSVHRTFAEERAQRLYRLRQIGRVAGSRRDQDRLRIVRHDLFF